jgi:hypothetical protein
MNAFEKQIVEEVQEELRPKLDEQTPERGAIEYRCRTCGQLLRTKRDLYTLKCGACRLDER